MVDVTVAPTGSLMEPEESPTAAVPETSRPRAPRNRLIFSANTELAQAIYSYTVEAMDLEELFRFPPEISLHKQPNVTVTDPGGVVLPIELPKGLRPQLLFTSGDGQVLATLQPAFGGHPNYLHQIELANKGILSIKLLEGYEWVIPLVPGRIPSLLDFVGQGAEPEATVLLGFDRVKWSPDSTGFVFTIGDPTGPVNQIYYVARGLTTVQPLAADAPGTDIGTQAAWSPDGRRIAYARNWSREGIWVIEMASPETATRGVELPRATLTVDSILWLGNQDLLFTAYEEVARGRDAAYLYLAELDTGRVLELASAIPPDGQSAAVYIEGKTADAKGLVIRETYAKPITRSGDILSERLIFVDLVMRTTKVIKDGTDIRALAVSPVEDWVHIAYGDPCVGEVGLIPSGETLIGPRDDLCLGGAWSPDGHLLGGFSRGDIAVWELASGKRTVVGADVPGEKIFLGWIAEP